MENYPWAECWGALHHLRGLKKEYPPKEIVHDQPGKWENQQCGVQEAKWGWYLKKDTRVMIARLLIKMSPIWIPTQQQFGIHPRTKLPLWEALWLRYKILKVCIFQNQGERFWEDWLVPRCLNFWPWSQRQTPKTALYPSKLTKEGPHLARPISKNWKWCLLPQMYRYYGQATYSI